MRKHSHTEPVTVQLGHDVQPTYIQKDNILGEMEFKRVDFCQRCGAIPGSEKFEAGCRKAHVPQDIDDEEKVTAPLRPRPRAYQANGAPTQKSPTFHPALEEYFGTADYVGGLVSRFGRDLEGWTPGGGTTNALPPYMKMPKDLLARLRGAYQALRQMGAGHTATLRAFYEGNLQIHGDDSAKESVTQSHALFELLYQGPERAPRAERHGARGLTSRELAEASGVSERHMRRLMADAGIAAGRNGPEQLPHVLHEDILEELADEFGFFGREAA